jgi:hypothetical protein
MISRMQELTLVDEMQPVCSPALAEALGQLGYARACAQSTRRDTWDFAVEIDSLLAAGVTKSDLRWLVSEGYLSHAEESSCPHDAARQFQLCQNLAFSARTCFVLTEAGAQLTTLTPGAMALPLKRLRVSVAGGTPAEGGLGPKPSWDPDRRVLRVGDEIVKQFRVPSPSQEVVLAAFEEEGWPPAIDDPLPPHAEQDRKRRLSNTIQSLNASHKTPLLHFRGNGTGDRIYWELQEQPTRHHPLRVRPTADAA